MAKKRKIDLNLLVTALGVGVALFIGAMQLHIANLQRKTADRQADLALLQGEIQAVSSWLPFLKDDDPNVRYTAVISLERIKTEAVVAPLVTALSDPEQNIRKRAAAALGDLASDSTVDVIISILDNQDPKTQQAAVDTLVEIGYEWLPAITGALDRASPRARAEARKAIERILLNEHALNKIGALEAQRSVSGSAEIVVAILGAGVDRSMPDLDRARVQEFSHLATSEPPGESTTLAARLIVGSPDSDVVGVAPGVRLISEQVIGPRGGSVDTVVTGIRHAVAAGARIVYLELGGSSFYEPLQQAIDEAHAAGTLIIAAAGNASGEEKEYPAAMDHVLAVAATEPDDRKSDYSNYGSWVDLCAPGNPLAGGRYPDSQLAQLKGTSFSGSLVAGAAALLWSADPSASSREIESLLLGTADDIDAVNPAYRGKLGRGRVNVAKAISGLRSRSRGADDRDAAKPSGI